VLCFGAFALLAPVLGRRVGAERLLWLSLIPIAVGVAGRAAGSTVALFAGTIVAGVGIAIGNVIVPSIVKSRFERAAGLVMGIYVATLTAGAALAAGLTVPLEQSLGWQAALAVWALPALVALAVLGAAVLGTGAPASIQGREVGVRRLLRDRLAWQVTLYMGFQSLVFYAGLAWLAPILRDDGYSAGTAGGLLAVYALGGIPSAAVVPVLAERMRDQRALAAVVCALEGLGLLGLLVAPGAALVWVTVLALGQGGAFSLALAFMVLRAPDGRVAADLSGMAQGFGYALAALGPFAIGALDDWSGSWNLALGVLVVLTVPLIVVGIQAGRARTVGTA
jgi:CP family cyanate transporter-like MFS transporter